MFIAREGLPQIALTSLVLGLFVALGVWLFWPLAVPFVVVWLWVLWFFRDPRREKTFQVGELCAACDGRVRDITRIEHYDPIGGPAIRIGVFMSLFSVHINRSPCSGRVKSVFHRPGEFLDARHPESGRRNESNTILIDPDNPMPGPVEVRQIAGLVARRIVCHATPDQTLKIGSRFGLIKFGSRTELVIPDRRGTEIKVEVGDEVQAGLTVFARQSVDSSVDSGVIEGGAQDVASALPASGILE